MTVPNLLLSIKPQGQILYMLRLKLTFSCMMELNKYPLDDQICTMEIASCKISHLTAFFTSHFPVSKTTRELVLKWSPQPVKLSPEVKMPQFKVQDVIAEECDESAVLGEDICLLHNYRAFAATFWY